MLKLRPTDLIDFVTDLAAWTMSYEGMVYWTGHLMAQGVSLGDITPKDVVDPYKAIRNDRIRAAMAVRCEADADRIAGSTIFYVADNMVELAHQASKTMKPQPFVRSDFPTDTGFMWIDGGIIIKDIWQNDLVVSSIAWVINEQDSVTLMLYTDMEDPRDADYVFKKDRKNTLPHFRHATELSRNTFEFGIDLQQKISNDYTVEDFYRKRGVTASEEEIIEHFLKPLRFTQALLAIMAQEIPLTYHIEASRAQRKRAIRQKKRPPDPVKLITLRREQKESNPITDPELRGRSYSHRWIVRGHWRTINHPRTKVQRQVWVMPHEKGPKDAPLIIKDEIYVVKR